MTVLLVCPLLQDRLDKLTSFHDYSGRKLLRNQEYQRRLDSFPKGVSKSLFFCDFFLLIFPKSVVRVLGEEAPDRPLIQQMRFINAEIKWEEILSGVLKIFVCLPSS